MKGIVVAVNCGVYSVNYDGIIYRMPARGLFRNKGIKPTVGDYVEIDENNMVLKEIYPRTSLLKRPPIANIDQLLIVESLLEPEFSYLLAFKYLTYANMNNVKTKIILTKEDKLDNDDKIKEIKDVFAKFNIEVYSLSTKTNKGVDEVKKLFRNHVTALIGQTGVGKSSLINAIDSNYERTIGEYSKALGRGKHQTKEVILLPYEGGFIADTPGFSSLDLNLYKEDLARFYPGFMDLYTECYFTNCLHISENKCKVKEAFMNNQFPSIAYECYLKLSSEALYHMQRYDK